MNEVLKETWKPLFFGLIVMFVFFGIGGVWSVMVPIDGAVHANGEVVVSSKRKIVQHFGDGIIRKILVKEGQEVKKDEPLVLLNNTNEKANLSVIKEKFLSVLATEARLIAISKGSDKIDFPNEIKEFPDMDLAKKVMKNQVRLFDSQSRSITNKITILLQRIKHSYAELKGLDSQMNAAFKQYNLLSQELEMKKKLFNVSNIDKAKTILALEKQLFEVEGKIGFFCVKISQVQQRIEENDLKITNLKDNSKGRANIKLKAISIAVTDLRKKLTVAEDLLARTIIRSPQKGIVTDIRYHTEGAVIKSGVPIMSVIPSNDDLIIEAKVKTSNIEEVLLARRRSSNIVFIDGLEGLKAKIRISSYSARRLSLINGIVRHISPDVLDDSRLGHYYLVRIVLPKSELAKFKNLYLYPGMPVEIYIVTQSRTLLSFLLTPIILTFDRSFIER